MAERLPQVVGPHIHLHHRQSSSRAVFAALKHTYFPLQPPTPPLMGCKQHGNITQQSRTKRKIGRLSFGVLTNDYMRGEEHNLGCKTQRNVMNVLPIQSTCGDMQQREIKKNHEYNESCVIICRTNAATDQQRAVGQDRRGDKGCPTPARTSPSP